MLIPLFSPTIRRSEMDAVLTCLVEEKVGPGEMVVRLEKKVSEFFGVPAAVALRSPAIALEMALQLLQLPSQAKVALSALAPCWQYIVLKRLNYIPLVLDVDRQTALVTLNEVERAISEGAQVLLLHETLGNVPSLDFFCHVGIPIIEDISQSAGAEFLNPEESVEQTEPTVASSSESDAQAIDTNVSTDNQMRRKAGTHGVFTILGLEEHDMLTGGGGAILFVSDKRNVGPLKKVASELPSTDRLPDINAALGFVQLKNAKKNREIKRTMETAFRRALLSTKHTAFVFAQEIVNPVFSFPIVLERGFKEVERYTQKKQIEIALAFTDSVVAYCGETLTACENAKSLLLRTVLFPLYPRLGTKVELVGKVISTLP